MIDVAEIFLAKAEESSYGALSELTNRRYNNCASRCYYASFQAAIYALTLAGIEPPAGPESQWGHAFVQSQFAGQLIPPVGSSRARGGRCIKPLFPRGPSSGARERC